MGAQSCGCVSALEWESARSGYTDKFVFYLTLGHNNGVRVDKGHYVHSDD